MTFKELEGYRLEQGFEGKLDKQKRLKVKIFPEKQSVVLFTQTPDTHSSCTYLFNSKSQIFEKDKVSQIMDSAKLEVTQDETQTKPMTRREKAIIFSLSLMVVISVLLQLLQSPVSIMDVPQCEYLSLDSYSHTHPHPALLSLKRRRCNGHR